MSPLDLLILVAVLSAIVGGYRLGFLARITSWAGLALGVFLGALFLPDVAQYFDEAEPGVRALAAIAFLLAAGMLGQGLGLGLGAALHASLRVGPGFRRYDRIFGALVGAVGILVVFWLLAPSLVRMPGVASKWTRDSAIVGTIGTVLPGPPEAFRDLGRVLGSEFPQVFDSFDRSPEVGAPPADSPLAAPVREQVIGSTLKIHGQACRKVQEGSGFVAGPDLVVTNAHVVAGEDATEVITSDGRTLAAQAVVFDSDRDLAVLRVPGLDRQPLALGRAEDGERGSVFGHPGGGALEESPAQISQRVTARGSDIYDQHRTRRDVFILAASLAPGDSGGPLVNPAGEVVGVAFAIAPDRPNTAYALTDEELNPVLAEVGPNAVDTGPCVA